MSSAGYTRMKLPADAVDPNPTQTEGGQEKVVVSEVTLQELMGSILIELRKMNIYLSQISDIEIDDYNVEQED